MHDHAPPDTRLPATAGRVDGLDLAAGPDGAIDWVGMEAQQVQRLTPDGFMELVAGKRAPAGGFPVTDFEPKRTLEADSKPLVRLSVPEIRRLLCGLVWRFSHAVEAVIRWSHWRRAHQAIAKRCHYRLRAHNLCPKLQL